jgi:transposase
MDMIGRIRRLHVRDKLSEREIARMTGLSRNTVSKWLRAPVAEAPRYRREARPNKLSAFEAMLKQALTAGARRPKHERRTARALHAEIKAAGSRRCVVHVEPWRFECRRCSSKAGRSSFAEQGYFGEQPAFFHSRGKCWTRSASRYRPLTNSSSTS